LLPLLSGSGNKHFFLLMDYLPQFKLWLQNKHYSDATIRNYIVDLGKYLNYVNSLPQTTTMDEVFSTDILSRYVSNLTGNHNTARYLASLNQFCLFAVDQSLISQNPLKAILKQLHTASKPASPDITDLLKLYEQQLIHQKTSPTTIRNYLNDLHQYISWLDTQKIET
jgi:site-specific recombinase XerD